MTSGKIAHNSQHDQPQYVVDDRCRENDLAADQMKQTFASSTCAVIPTLVATIAAPDESRFDQRIAPGAHNAEPSAAAQSLRALRPEPRSRPTRISSEAFTSSPTRNSRNITPSSDRAVKTEFG